MRSVKCEGHSWPPKPTSPPVPSLSFFADFLDRIGLSLYLLIPIEKECSVMTHHITTSRITITTAVVGRVVVLVPM